MLQDEVRGFKEQECAIFLVRNIADELRQVKRSMDDRAREQLEQLAVRWTRLATLARGVYVQQRTSPQRVVEAACETAVFGDSIVEGLDRAYAEDRNNLFRTLNDQHVRGEAREARAGERGQDGLSRRGGARADRGRDPPVVGQRQGEPL